LLSTKNRHASARHRNNRSNKTGDQVQEMGHRATGEISVSKAHRLKVDKYEGRSESKERFAIQIYLLIIRKKQNMQVLSHTFTYFST